MPKIISKNNQYISNGQLQPNDEIGRTQVQPLNRDWVEMLPSYFVYSSATLITVNSFDVSEFFQIGDRLSITQAGTEKFFYIIDVDSDANTIGIAGATGAAFTNTSITKIMFSRVSAPARMGAALAFTPTITADAGTPSFSDSAIYFSVEGPYTTLYLDCGIQSIDAGATQLDLTLPVSVKSYTDVDVGDTEDTFFSSDITSNPSILAMAIYHAISVDKLQITANTDPTRVFFGATSFRINGKKFTYRYHL